MGLEKWQAILITAQPLFYTDTERGLSADWMAPTLLVADIFANSRDVSSIV